MLTHDEGRQPIAIGHLSDSGDLKIRNICVIAARIKLPMNEILHKLILFKFLVLVSV